MNHKAHGLGPVGFFIARVRFQQSTVQTGDTIIACATAPGFSARAIVRVSGPGAFGIVEALERPGAQGTNLADARLVARDPRRARGIASSRIVLDGGASIPCLIASSSGPASYTGEDVVEFILPGNPHLIERVMRVAMERVKDVRLAGPGEFTARAFLNERMTLEQAEGVGALIAAESAEELEEAKRLLSGERGGHYRAFSDEAMTLMALVEAGIDFTDQEDVVAIEPAELTRRASALADSIEALLQAHGGSEERKGMARVVLAGAPNAGKSTLFNALLGRRRAVVSPVAGTTRDVLEEELDLSRDGAGAGRVLLCDTAGLAEGEGKFSIEMAAASKRAIGEADVVVWCDPAGRFEGGSIAPTRGAMVRVRTKADLPHADSGEAAIEVSALDGYRLPTLRRAIADAAWGQSGRGGLLSRHRRALREAAAALRELHGEESRRSPEIAAGRLRRVLDSLGELTGRMSPDEVIGRVFATFCVGK